MGVGEAAEMLGLRPRSVLRLITDGELPAHKELGRWLVLRADVEVRLELGAHEGRRFAPATAWGFILLGSGLQAPWLDRITRWRIHQRLASPWPRLRHALASRASLRRYSAHPDSVSQLRDERDLMRSGLGAAEAAGLGVIGAGDGLEAYIRDERLPDIVRRSHLRQDPSGLVVLRAVLPDAPPGPLPPIAPQLAIALDLLESHEPRARQVGLELLSRLETDYRVRPGLAADG